MDPRYFKLFAGLFLIFLLTLFKACAHKPATDNVDSQYPLPPHCKEAVLAAPKWSKDFQVQFLEQTVMNWVIDAKGSEEAAFKIRKQAIQKMKQEHNLNNQELMHIWKDESRQCKRALSESGTPAK